jgi:hypothetical protein
VSPDWWRSRVSTGGEFEKPDHGLYVGFLVRVKAFKDGISVPSFYLDVLAH